MRNSFHSWWMNSSSWFSLFSHSSIFMAKFARTQKRTRDLKSLPLIWAIPWTRSPFMKCPRTENDAKIMQHFFASLCNPGVTKLNFLFTFIWVITSYFYSIGCAIFVAEFWGRNKETFGRSNILGIGSTFVDFLILPVV